MIESRDYPVTLRWTTGRRSAVRLELRFEVSAAADVAAAATT
jgi:hypothetical protein